MVVTVAPAGYTGQADYYCTGVNDEILINSAIQYVSSAYGGGTIHLLEGTFNLVSHTIPAGVSCIDMLDNCTLEGSGNGTKIQSNLGDSLSAISVVIAAVSKQRVKVQNLYLPSFSGLTTGSIGIFYSLVTNSDVLGVTGESGFNTIIQIDNGSSFCKVNNNMIDGKLTTTGNFGIFVRGDYCIVSGNHVINMKQLAAGMHGINVTGTSNIVTSNFCFNNGNDTGIANTNGNNFSDTGTLTQVHSNSWQPIQNAYTIETTYTPTLQGFGTAPTVVNFTWVRAGNRAFFNGKVIAGAVPTATEGRLYFPSTMITDSSILPTLQLAGHWANNVIGVAYHTVLAEASVSYVTFGFAGAGTAGLTKQNGNALFGAGVTASFRFDIPMAGANV